MNSLLVAPGIMVGIGLFFGTVLAVAQRFLKVDEDPRIEATNELLPGTNCGACGEPGCRGLAEKLVDLDPSNHVSALRLADLLLRRGETTSALKVYERLGQMLLDAGKLDEAEVRKLRYTEDTNHHGVGTKTS